MEAQKQMAERERVYLQESLQESIRDGSIQMDNIMEGMDQQRVDSVYTPAAGSAEAMYNELLKDILKRKEELENELHILEESSEGGIILKRGTNIFWRNCWPCRSKTAMDRSWWCMVWMIKNRSGRNRVCS